MNQDLSTIELLPPEEPGSHEGLITALALLFLNAVEHDAALVESSQQPLPKAA